MSDPEKRLRVIDAVDKDEGITIFLEPGNGIWGLVRPDDGPMEGWSMAVYDASNKQCLPLDSDKYYMSSGPDGVIDACYPAQDHDILLSVRSPSGDSTDIPLQMQRGEQAVCIIGNVKPTPQPDPQPAPTPEEVPDQSLLIIEAEPNPDSGPPAEEGWVETTGESLARFLYKNRTNWPGALQDLKKVAEHLREFGGAKFYVMDGKGPGKVGKKYLVFKGNPHKPGKFIGLRNMIRGSGPYSFNNPRIVQLGFGARNALKAGAKGTVISFVIVGGIDVIDELMQDEPSLIRLGVTIGVDTVKLILSLLAGAGAAGAATVLGGTVLLVAGAGLLVALGVGLALDALDNRLGITDWLRERAKEMTERVEAEANRFLYRLEQCLLYQYGRFGF